MANNKQYNDWSVDLHNAEPYTLQAVSFLGIPHPVYNIENSDNEVLRMFDAYSGIDLIGNNNNQIYGIASRIQYNVAYNTFTIRYARHTGTKTEYAKRIHAIKNGYMYPRFTLQAYVKDEQIVSAAIMLTVDLYNFMDENPSMVHTKCSDNEFKFVKWADIETSKYPIICKQQ